MISSHAKLMKSAVGYDLDGTILNNNSLYTKSWKFALDSYGILIPEGFFISARGTSSKLALSNAGITDENLVEMLIGEKKKYLNEHLDETKVYGDFFYTANEHISKGRIPIICTTADTNYLNSLLEIIPELKPLLKNAVTKEQYVNSKPHAEPLSVTMQKLGISNPSHFVYVGDSKNDYETAKNAGVDFIHFKPNTDLELPVLSITTHKDILKYFK